ncbi:MAG: hypothetical protein UT26_C0011G0008 [Microgenomates group bacterium GW2011_GWC1_39_12]|nr:MAG: hypothetical protein UT26_C0011G0008 [Microgenomates group bacterium GW2011_GWC1_39_12]
MKVSETHSLTYYGIYISIKAFRLHIDRACTAEYPLQGRHDSIFWNHLRPARKRGTVKITPQLQIEIDRIKELLVKTGVTGICENTLPDTDLTADAVDYLISHNEAHWEEREPEGPEDDEEDYTFLVSGKKIK